MKSAGLLTLLIAAALLGALPGAGGRLPAAEGGCETAADKPPAAMDSTGPAAIRGQRDRPAQVENPSARKRSARRPGCYEPPYRRLPGRRGIGTGQPQRPQPARRPQYHAGDRAGAWPRSKPTRPRTTG